MKLIQVNPGHWLGAYYMLLQSSASYATFPNLVVSFFNMWALWELKIKNIVSWMNLPIFISIVVVLMFGILPIFHYVFMQRSVIAFQNEQAYRHENPIADDLRKIKEKLGIKDETFTGH